MTCGYRITLFALAATIGCRGDFYPSDNETGSESDTGSEASSEDGNPNSTEDGDTTHGAADDGGSSGEETTEPGSTEGSTTEEETDTSESNTDPTTETDSPTDDPTDTDPTTETPTDDPTDTPTDSSSTGTPGPLGPDMPCHPMAEEAGEPPCGNILTCAFLGWDPDVDSYQWKCKIYSGDEPGGEFEDSCYEYTSCKNGFICLADVQWPDGECDSAHCCTEYCDLQNDMCPAGMQCEAIANEPDQYPEQVRNSSIALVGYCIKS